MAGVATASYAFPLTPVSSKEAGACQGFGIHGHVVLGHGCPHCRLQEAPRGSAAWQHHGDPPEAPGGPAPLSQKHERPGGPPEQITVSSQLATEVMRSEWSLLTIGPVNAEVSRFT